MAHTSRLAVYPGSFDPLTNGHVDIIDRGLRLFDRIVVAVLTNPSKHPLFSPDERVAIIREVFAGQANVDVDMFDGLLVDYVRRRQATAIVRGVRVVSDFEYEWQMALMNRHLDGAIDTVFLMPSERFTYVSATLVREIAALGGPLAGLVPPAVEARLANRRHAATSRRV
ncbi:MAG TPA: pantetheine-phosphate adenylyltransferase [Vicinamibacterales bacterium]|nr:pantetheine-phosphate adenylyltransferase [Vicinamibacterales bacterium]